MIVKIQSRGFFRKEIQVMKPRDAIAFSRVIPRWKRSWPVADELIKKSRLWYQDNGGYGREDS